VYCTTGCNRGLRLNLDLICFSFLIFTFSNLCKHNSSALSFWFSAGDRPFSIVSGITLSQPVQWGYSAFCLASVRHGCVFRLGNLSEAECSGFFIPCWIQFLQWHTTQHVFQFFCRYSSSCRHLLRRFFSAWTALPAEVCLPIWLQAFVGAVYMLESHLILSVIHVHVVGLWMLEISRHMNWLP